MACFNGGCGNRTCSKKVFVELILRSYIFFNLWPHSEKKPAMKKNYCDCFLMIVWNFFPIMFVKFVAAFGIFEQNTPLRVSYSRA